MLACRSLDKAETAVAASQPGDRLEFFGPRFPVRGRTPVHETPSRAARDTDAAERLWEDSARRVGFDPVDALRAQESRRET